MLIMAIPMYLLYEGGLIMARVMVRMRAADAAKRAQEEEAEA
jgi:Sec-independent protein secretion pathway component TatC